MADTLFVLTEPPPSRQVTWARRWHGPCHSFTDVHLDMRPVSFDMLSVGASHWVDKEQTVIDSEMNVRKLMIGDWPPPLPYISGGNVPIGSPFIGINMRTTGNISFDDCTQRPLISPENMDQHHTSIRITHECRSLHTVQTVHWAHCR